MKKRYVLKRINDGQQWVSDNVKYIEWVDDMFGGLHDDIAINRSCMLNPEKGMFYIWLTTPIDSFEYRDSEIHFRTKNSHYILAPLDDE